MRELRSRLAAFKGSCIFNFVAKKITNFLVLGWPTRFFQQRSRYIVHFILEGKARYRGTYVSCCQFHLVQQAESDDLCMSIEAGCYLDTSVADAASDTEVEIASVVADS